LRPATRLEISRTWAQTPAAQRFASNRQRFARFLRMQCHGRSSACQSIALQWSREMWIDQVSPDLRQKGKTFVQRLLAGGTAAAIVLALAGGAALWHEERTASIEASSDMSLRDQVWDGRVGTAMAGDHAGGIYAVVDAFSGSEEAIVSAVRDCNEGRSKLQ
jgi:hypothetical protein